MSFRAFNTIDHLTGAVGIRLQRAARKIQGKPDLTFVDQNLAIGGYCNIKKLSENKIDAILDLREENFDDKDELKKYSIQYLRIPIPDRGTPTLEKSLEAVQWIKSNLGKNKRVYIHCNLGRGRAPLMACTYLISQGTEKQDAIRLVGSKRRYMYLNQQQLRWIKEFQNTQTKS